ncbi:hypothetical protein BZL39_D00120 [Zygosaccharomyces parabailii]|nr:hypothetical protein BZL39_D00120 [Zygosaccharomyces parabailii]
MSSLGTAMTSVSTLLALTHPSKSSSTHIRRVFTHVIKYGTYFSSFVFHCLTSSYPPRVILSSYLATVYFMSSDTALTSAHLTTADARLLHSISSTENLSWNSQRISCFTYFITFCFLTCSNSNILLKDYFIKPTRTSCLLVLFTIAVYLYPYLLLSCLIILTPALIVTYFHRLFTVTSFITGITGSLTSGPQLMK